mmetsp:Transcript_9358/g.13997  ORF Transcript_9358/g.13997 Transcript_9358/m.13997 type:complete len:577 (+) Transcript_9358:153-1883(+)|eukprot:CAMPEP_0194082532 /NCGR_PEP_ID=MMETSP0149-20130528/8014_1 /TAXON_ID=122233 /ORGANISM="Chaetoceros debilis, Strain MM31A-1" /LENGTH=576 /DNA_ID=CAMNT_0038764701 /DNA_START=158 /DNA_END=1888 /DNA_ORIENTATION=-
MESELDGAASEGSAIIEVDYNLNPTEIYVSICNSDWEGALVALEKNPLECKTWVVKRDPYSDNDDAAIRFLPLHSACAREPPLDVIIGLLTIYPEGASVVDDNGMLPLHYACANQATAEVIGLLLLHNPEANRFRVDMSGSLPVHLAAQWGVSSPEVMDILLEDNKSLACARDNDECTPYELALSSEFYSRRYEVIEILRLAYEEEMVDDGDDSTISTRFSIFNNRKGGKTRRRSFVFGSKSYDSRQSFSRGRSMDTRDQMISELDAMKEEIAELRERKVRQKASVKDQIAREWDAVNITIKEMQRQIDAASQSHVHSKSSQSHVHSQQKSETNDLHITQTGDFLSRLDTGMSLTQDIYARQSLDSYLSYESYENLTQEEDNQFQDQIQSKKSQLEQLTSLFLAPSLLLTPKMRNHGKSSEKKKQLNKTADRDLSKEPQRKSPSTREGKLKRILDQNKRMKRELNALTNKRNAYVVKLKATEDVITELSKTVKDMMNKHVDTNKKLIVMETDLRNMTRTRRSMLQAILKEMADSRQESKRLRPKGVSSIVKKHEKALIAMDKILSDMKSSKVSNSC